MENHHKTMSDDFLLLFNACKQQGQQVKAHYLQVATSSWLSIIKRSIVLLWDISNAGCIVLNESNSLFGAFSLRKQSRMIQLWHGCGAFKKWGFSLVDKTFGDTKEDLNQYNGHKNYSLVPVSGDAVCWAYQEAFGIKEQAVVQPMGVSRTDSFFDNTKVENAKEKVNRFLNSKGVDTSKKIMLYMPTFRGSIKEASTPNKLDVKRFLEKFGNDYVLLIKQHPFVKLDYPVPQSCENACIEVKEELTSFELMVASDCMITDYSSVIFEYSLLNKPMLFFAFDLDDYFDERGFYYEYNTFVPGPISKTMDELLVSIEQLEQWDAGIVTRFKNSYMNGCDGQATSRVMSYIKKHD